VKNITGDKVAEILRLFILENYPKARQGVLQADDRLIGKGIIDSLGLLMLIDFVEIKFEIKISDLDVTEDKFGSIASLSSFIKESLAKKP